MAIIKLSEGHYALRWRDATGKRYYETLRKGLPYDSVKKIHAAKLAARRETHESTATVAELADSYLTLRGPHLTPLGHERAESIIRLHIKGDPIGKLVAATLKTKDVLQWRLRRKNSKPSPSDATLDREFNLLRAIVNFAVKTDELRASPLKRGAVKRLVSSGDGRIVYFQPEEWRAFIAALDDDKAWTAYLKKRRRFGPEKIGLASDKPRRYGAGMCPGCDNHEEHTAASDYRQRLLQFKPIFSALLWTGCRLSEVRLLKWEDVDFRSGVLRIPQSKTSRAKAIPLSPEMKADLESLTRGVGKAFIYAKPDGTPRSLREIQRAFEMFRDVAGLREELTPHAIRHTVASWLVIAGRPIKEVQEYLGHQSLAMTLRYVHLAPAHLAGAVTALATMRDSVQDETKESSS